MEMELERAYHSQLTKEYIEVFKQMDIDYKECKGERGNYYYVLNINSLEQIFRLSKYLKRDIIIDYDYMGVNSLNKIIIHDGYVE